MGMTQHLRVGSQLRGTTLLPSTGMGSVRNVMGLKTLEKARSLKKPRTWNLQWRLWVGMCIGPTLLQRRLQCRRKKA